MALLLPEQPTIHVDVAYYNPEERDKLLKYPSADQIELAVKHGLNISTAEFLVYYLFHRKRTGHPNYKSYNEISKRLYKAFQAIDEYVEFTGTSICQPELDQQLNEITERIGESVGLSVISRIHKMHGADWSPIPEQRGRNADPTFDYEDASDGRHLIQLETKGSSVPNNTKLSQAIYTHKHEILEKKRSIRAQNRD